MWICDQRSNAFRRPRTPKHAQPLLCTPLPFRQPFQPLIQRPLYGGLRDTKVARAQALVEASYAFLPQDLLHRRERAAMQFSRLLLKLQSCLDHPDRVRRCAGRDARARCRAEVYPGILLPVVEATRDDVLAVTVGEEVDRTRGDDTD